MIAGVISDTHGYLDERVAAYFAEVDLIIHAGDVGSLDVLSALARIAPVFAVEGNNDEALDLGLEQVLLLNLEGHRVQVVHHLEHAEQGSDVVIHGHSHKQRYEFVDGVMLLNPGAAGRRGFHKVQSVALLHLTAGVALVAELIALGPRLSTVARRPRSSR